MRIESGEWKIKRQILGKMNSTSVIKLDRAFVPRPGQRMYRKKELLGLLLRASFLAELAARLDLTYLEEDEVSATNLCLANSREVRPEYRTVFGQSDILRYCAARLPDRNVDIHTDTLPLPESAAVFWSFAEAGL